MPLYCFMTFQFENIFKVTLDISRIQILKWILWNPQVKKQMIFMLCLSYLFQNCLAENVQDLRQTPKLKGEYSNTKNNFYLVNPLILNVEAHSSILIRCKLCFFSIPEQRPLLSFLEYTLCKTFLNINKSKLPSKGFNVTTLLQ